LFEKVQAEKDDRGRRVLAPTGEPDVHIPCDDVLVAVGQENAFPWIESDAGIAFRKDGLPAIDPVTFQSSLPSVFFGGDAALGPKNIITAVAHGHEAAISIDAYCRGEDQRLRPDPMTNLVSQKMGIHEWSYDNAITLDRRFAVPHVERAKALKNIETEVELGFTDKQALAEAQRCLNCDVQTVFSAPVCIECDACVDICPIDCISFVPNAPEAELRRSLNVPALNLTQAIYVSEPVKTGRIMAKDEDLCLHCGLCAERCPTGAWDMQKFTIEMAQAGAGGSCRSMR
jgi:formate hydrogenlyase subunit 6/NADH:ubiquinone oxidoreductase subunit I